MACTTKNRSDRYRYCREAQYGFRELKHKIGENKFTNKTAGPIAERIQASLESLLKEDRSDEDGPVFVFELAKKGEKEEKERLSAANVSLESENSNLKKAEKEAEDYINTLTSELKKGEGVISELEKEKKRLESDICQSKETEKEDKNHINTLLLQVKQKDGVNSDLEKENKWLEEKYAQLEETNKTDRNHYEVLQGELNGQKENINKLTKENDRLRDELALQTGQRESLEDQCKRKEETIADLQRANKELIVRKEGLTKEMEATMSTVQRLEKEKKELEDYIEKMTNEIKRQAVETQDFARAYENQRTDNYNLNIQINQMSRSLEEQRRTIDKLQKTLSEEKKAKENALNRLSAAAANRLRDQNPGITDLSDPNRPLKLAEKVSELYDNEWTNAMENLESDLNIPEEKGIRILLKIIKNVFDTCTEFGDNHLQSFPDMLILPPSFIKTDQERMLNVKDLPPEMLKPMKDFRKSHAKHAINRLQKFLTTDEGISKLQIKKKVVKSCAEYINKCIELCWMMRIQDPPIYMETGYPTNSEFDSNKMRSYTKAGKFIHFVVWPTFFLHKDGPLLAKGVVQGSKTAIKDGKEINGDDECSSSNSETDGEEYDDARSRTDSQPNDNLKETISQDDDKDIPTNAQHPNQQGNTETIQEADGTSINVTKDKPEGANETEDEPEGPNDDTHISQSTLSRSEATDQQKEANSDKTKEENMNGREMTTEKTDASNDKTQNDN